MKKFGRTLIASMLVSSMVVSSAFAAPSVSDIEANKAQAEGEVSSLQTQLTKIVKKINNLEDKLVKKGEEIEKANTDLTAAEAKEKEQYSAMKLRIKYMYEESGDGYLEKLLESQSIADLLNQAQYVQEVHTYDRNMLNSYVETKNQIATLKTGLEKDQKKLESLQKDFTSEKQDLSTTLESKKSEVANLDEELQAAVAAAAAEEAAAKAAQEAAAKEAQSANAGQTANNADNNTSNGTSNNDSNDNKADDSSNNSSNDDSGSTSSGNKSAASAIVSAAYSYIGVPYVWGGASRNGMDCSGLVMLCYASAGISVAHSSGTLGGSHRVSSPQPGDVCCGPGHVGIYIGGGKMIHAPTTGQTVKIANVQSGMWYTRWY